MMVELVQDLWKDAGLELRTQVDERAGVEVLALLHEHLNTTISVRYDTHTVHTQNMTTCIIINI